MARVAPERPGIVVEDAGAGGRVHAAPGRPGSVVEVRTRYDNFIGGEWVPPVTGGFATDHSPADGSAICEVPQSTPEDIELALDAAHAATHRWGAAAPADRARVLHRIADAIEANLEMLAVAESWESGKPVRQTLGADLPLAIDQFRYFAAAVRSLEGGVSQIDQDTVAYHFHEPLGVVGQIIPFNFPIVMAAWKLAPALAAGNCAILKPASPTPWSLLKLAEVIQDVVPPGVINIVNGAGDEIGRALAQNRRIARVSFTGETTTGRRVMQYAAENGIPATAGGGAKCPNVFFADVMSEDDDFLDKAIEGLLLFTFNKGEVCACPSRALIQDSIYDEFMARCLARIRTIRQGNPLDPWTMIGAQVSARQLRKITSYVELGQREGARCLAGGQRAVVGGECRDGHYFAPTVLEGDNSMRVFQEEIFGPVLAVTTFRDEAEAVAIANDAVHGLGAGVWTRDGSRAYRVGRAIRAGRVWTNCYHLYPPHAAFGADNLSGLGPDNHAMTLRNYSRIKNLLVSYSDKPLNHFWPAAS